MDVDLSKLRIFVAVASAGSITRGAAVLRMQQPTVSRAVAALEAELGTELFERRPRGVALTARGRALREACEPLLSALESRVADALSAPGAPGVLTLGAAELVASAILPRVHGRLQASWPTLVPYALVGPADVLADRVGLGALSFALVMHVRKRPGMGVRAIEPALPHRLVVRADRAGDRRVLRRFIGSREVEDPGNRQFPTLDRLRRDVPEAALSASSNSLSAHKAMALDGQGVAILPEFFVRDELASGALTALYRDEPRAFPVLRLARTGTVWSGADRAYLAAVDAVIAELAHSEGAR